MSDLRQQISHLGVAETRIRRKKRSRYGSIALTACVLFQIVEPTERVEPIALHQLHEVSAESELVISLKGVTFSGRATTATVTTLPKSGSLYHVSKVFDTHGYDPKKGERIETVPMNVTSRDSKIVYARPPHDWESEGQWDSFSYTVTGKNGRTSTRGSVVLVPPTLKLAASTFYANVEGWRVYGNRMSDEVVHERSSRAAMSYYIYAADDLINVNENGDDVDLWYFLAPQKFTSWQVMAYKGSLDFTLSSFSGDFSESNLNFKGNIHLVKIHCASCAMGKGMTLGFPYSKTPPFNGNVQKYSILMHESAGWLRDPKNTLKDWIAPTKCEFLQVISDIESLMILGDLTRWYETMSIDDIVWRTIKPKGRLQMPLCAQVYPNAQRCTCSEERQTALDVLEF